MPDVSDSSTDSSTDSNTDSSADSVMTSDSPSAGADEIAPGESGPDDAGADDAGPGGEPGRGGDAEVEVLGADRAEPEPGLEAADASLRAQVAALEARLRTVSAAWRQQQDEIASTKERLARQAALKEELRRGEVVGILFEPVENLRRAKDAIQRAAGAEAVSGLDMVLHQFLDAFKKLGLEEVPGKGSRFDPNLHEAISAVPVADPALDGAVLEVFDTGYRIGSRLLKPARVVIGQLQDGLGEA